MREPDAAAAVELGSVDVESRSRRFEAPPVERLSGARIGGAIELFGYGLAASTTEEPALTPLAGGAALRVSLIWRDAEPARSDGLDTGYTVFVQLLDSEGHLVAQHDGPPADGAAPTTSWVAGEVIEDVHTLSVPPGARPGTYSLIAGLYDARTMRRLAVGATDHVVLDQLRLA